VVAVAIVVSCKEQPPTAPADIHPVFAKSGGTGPTVKSTDPSRSEPGVTLNVRVLGNGYSTGSRVDFGIAGIPSPKITTNSTTFVSSTELVANITIAADADLDSYDVIVITSEGKKGIGTEIFLVAYSVTDLGTASFTTSEARDVNPDGVIVGLLGNSVSPNIAHAVRWTYISPTQVETVDLHGLLQPALRTIAYSVNATGSIVGFRQIDSNTSSSRPFVISSAGVATTLHGVCGPTETSRQSHAYDISDNGDVIGTEINGGSWAIYWAPNSMCAELLPVPPGTLASEATHISSNGAFISGSIYDASNVLCPARWGRRADGTGWELTILGGVPGAGTTSVQDDGAVTGYKHTNTLVRKRGSSYYNLTTSGYVWTPDGVVSQVPYMGGDDLSPSGYGPLGLVGLANLVADGPSHAFVDDGYGPADLGVLVIGGSSWASATAGSFIVGTGQVNTPGRGIESHAMVWVAR
jgi:hypothetical protein